MRPATVRPSMAGPAAPPSRSAAIALGAAALAAALLVVAESGVPLWERAFARRVHDLPDVLTPVLRLVMQTGTRPAVVGVVVALVLLGHLRPAIVVGVAGFGSWFLSGVLKDVSGRSRPDAMTLGREVRDAAESTGFPSTHTAIAVALVVALLLTVPLDRWAVALAVVIAAGTGLARIHIDVHWPLDVLGGTALGTALAATAALFVTVMARHPAPTHQ